MQRMNDKIFAADKRVTKVNVYLETIPPTFFSIIRKDLWHGTTGQWSALAGYA